MQRGQTINALAWQIDYLEREAAERRASIARLKTEAAAEVNATLQRAFARGFSPAELELVRRVAVGIAYA